MTVRICRSGQVVRIVHFVARHGRVLACNSREGVA
jgi:hypothetical protein